MPTFHKIFELSFCISSVYDPSSMPPSDSLPWLCYHPCSGISATNTVLTTIRTVLLFSALQVFDNLLRFTGWYPFPTFIWMRCWGQHIWLCTSKSRNWKKKKFLSNFQFDEAKHTTTTVNIQQVKCTLSPSTSRPWNSFLRINKLFCLLRKLNAPMQSRYN